jgi:transcriptional regulator with XRE-family HTH domain
MTPGELIKQLRIQHALSQRELAHRAGSSQSAIARIEGGKEDVTWGRLCSVLAAMGDQPVLASERLPSRYNPDDLLRDRAMSPEARLATGISVDRFGSKMAIDAAKARAAARNAEST